MNNEQIKVIHIATQWDDEGNTTEIACGADSNELSLDYFQIINQELGDFTEVFKSFGHPACHECLNREV